MDKQLIERMKAEVRAEMRSMFNPPVESFIDAYTDRLSSSQSKENAMLTEERRKQLMTDLGMPNSQSLYSALQQVANEVEQATRAEVRAEVCSAQNSEYAPQESLSLTDATQVMAEAQEPIARTTGYFGGRCVVEPINPAMVIPTNLALYAAMQPPAPCPKCAQHEIDFALEHDDTVELQAKVEQLTKELAFTYKTAEHNFAQYQHVNDELQHNPAIQHLNANAHLEARIAELQDERDAYARSAFKQAALIEKCEAVMQAMVDRPRSHEATRLAVQTLAAIAAQKCSAV